MSYSTRVYRQRNAHVFDNDASKEESSFFTKSNEQSSSKGGKSAFFQPKLSIGQPNDVYEKEADAVASAVVNHQPGATPVIQQKKISSIQRLATPLEEEKLSTNDERMKKDKEIQEKPEIQMMCPGCEKERDEKEGAVQTKGGAGSSASPSLSSKIEGSAGKGNGLPKKILSEMNASFGIDFSQVNIHTDSEAVQMNKELGAQAFTHGRDIYFNSGKYDAHSSDGKQLLAHELTHVVQQGTAGQEITQSNPSAALENKINQASFASILTLQRQYEPTPEQIRDIQLRQFSARPSLALRQWKTLNKDEKDQVLRHMILLYGPPFTIAFLEYANGTKKPQIGPQGALQGFEYTPKWLYERGFRHAYDTLWVRPSGEEVLFLGSRTEKQEKEPPSCLNNCLVDSEDEDECRICCEEKFPESDNPCRKNCNASCNDKL
jgi:Domain of unknown function (DUF4157)